MKVLAFDTAMGACSAAALVDDRIVSHRFCLKVRGHAETVMQMVADVCDEAGLRVGDFDRLGVTVGPGTFTGQRVGLAAARGMVLGTSVALVGVTTLEAVAVSVKDPQAYGVIASVFDARRGEVYFQTFDRSLSATGEPAVAPPDHVARRLVRTGQKVCLVGTGAGLVVDALADDGGDIHVSDASPQPDARHVARIAARARGAGLRTPSPLYLRPPDAKLPAPKQGRDRA